MSKKQSCRSIRISPAAMRDIEEALAWSREHFGQNAAVRYGRLIGQAITDVSAEPERTGAKPREELAAGIWTYHLYFSRSRTGSGTEVKAPRHILVYRLRTSHLEIVRLLHDARELERHLPDNIRES